MKARHLTPALGDALGVLYGAALIGVPDWRLSESRRIGVRGLERLGYARRLGSTWLVTPEGADAMESLLGPVRCCELLNA